MSIPADIPPYELTELVPDFLKVYCNRTLFSLCHLSDPGVDVQAKHLNVKSCVLRL